MDTIEKYKEILKTYTKNLKDYRKAFQASDGGISEEEQKALDTLEEMIDKIKDYLLNEFIEQDKKKKTALDDIQTTLSVSPDANEINTFIMERINRIDTIVDEIDKKEVMKLLNGDWQQAKNALDSYEASLEEGHKKSLSSAINRVKQNIDQRIKKLGETVPELGNEERSATWEWTINEFRGNKAKKEDEIDKDILKYKNKLDEKFDHKFNENDKAKYKGRQRKWRRKIKELLNEKEALQADETKIIDTEKVLITVHFIEKTINLKDSDQKRTYWGISDVSLLQNRITKNNGGFSIHLDHTINFGNFSDLLSVKIELVRQEALQTVINAGEVASAVNDILPNPTLIGAGKSIAKVIDKGISKETVNSANETIDWQFSIQTNASNGKLKLSASPNNVDKILGELSYRKIKSIGKNITYQGDMDKANKQFLTEVEQLLTPRA